MRVAIVTESFPPDVNGVAHGALRTADISPEPDTTRSSSPRRPAGPGYPQADAPCPVVRVPSLPLPAAREAAARALEPLGVGAAPPPVHTAGRADRSTTKRILLPGTDWAAAASDSSGTTPITG